METKSLLGESICESPEATFEFGEQIGETLVGGEVILLNGTLGAGKTLLTKGIVSLLGFDIDEVTSPSFTLVNLYETKKFDVFHIDLWRIEKSDEVAFVVGLDEILENKKAVVIIEWADRLGKVSFDRKTLSIEITGDGDDPRTFLIRDST